MVGTMHSVDQELLHHAAALRSLARRLVGDEADDLVQDVVVQVLQRPPREPGPMHAWLRSIVRHLASSHHRDERRRLEHEAKGKTSETAAWPEQIAAHRETLHRLHTTLMNLQEPYRGILLARFYEGLTPTAIAARSGAPLATVKSSLQRGLAMLRERLDRGGEWRSSLCAALGIESVALVPVGAAAAWAGGIAMANAMKLAVGGVLLAAAVFACWPAPTSAPIGVERGQRAPAVAATTGLEPQPERLAVAPAAELRFRVLGVDDDAPLAPDRVEFSFGNNARQTVAVEGNGFRIPRADAYESLRVRVQGEHVAATDFWLLPADVTPDGETILRVRSVVPVVLRVVGDSAPMAGAAVDLESKEPPARPGRAPIQYSSRLVSAISDGTGVAKFSAVPPGIYTVSTRLQGWMVEQPGTLLVAAPNVEATVWLQRDDGWEVRGRVVDATTREGVAGAAILTLGMQVSATTDSAGVFVLPGEIRRASREAYFRPLVDPAPSDRAHGRTVAGPFLWEDREIVIALESARHFLRFDLGGAGEPVRVDWCKQPNRMPPPEPLMWEPLARGENGMYELPWLSDWPAMVWLRVQWGPGLPAEAPRYALASRLPVERASDGQVLVWKAPTVQALEVTVRDAQHAPVPGCSVEALFQAGTSIVGTAKAIPDYDPSLSNPMTANLAQALLTVRTDAQGSATLAVPVATGVALRTRADGFLDEVVEVGAENGIEIVLQRAGALHGEIANLDASNPRVYLVPEQGPRTASVGALVRRGAFAIESLPVGTYRVFLVDARGPVAGILHAFREYRYFDLGEASVTAGVVAEFRGDALGLRTVGVKASSRDLLPGDELVWHETRLGFQVARTPIEQLGAAKLSLSPGTYRVLRLRWEPGLSRQVGVFADELVSVAEPACATDITFPRGTLRCRLLDAGQPSCSTWLYVVGSSLDTITRTDPEGWVRFPVLPGTRFEVARTAPNWPSVSGNGWKLDGPRWRLGAGDEGRSIEVAER